MNGEKLFKSMNNINQEWIEQAKPANKPDHNENQIKNI